jgi:hypothetical protein
MEIILKIRFPVWVDRGKASIRAGTVVASSRTVQVFASTGVIAGEPKSAAAPISRRELPGDAAAQGPGRRWLYILYPGLIGSLVGDPSSGRCEACDTRLL